MTRRLILPLLILTLLIGGLSAVWGATGSPSNSLLNPATQALYTVSNGSGSIISYSTSGWMTSNPPTPISTVSLPSGAKSYGMAVGTSEAKLYVSVNNAASSAVRAYYLNSYGIPTGTYETFSGVPWGSTSSPTGAVKAGNRLFVADAAKVRIFNTDNFTFIKNITGELTGQTNLFGIAATPPSYYLTWVGGMFGHFVTNFTCKLYISRRTDPGSIFVYNYDSNGDTTSYVRTITTGISYPTYIKVVNGRCFVAVNGNDGVDVRVYSTTDDSLQGAVKSGVTGPYGWTGFDVDKEGHWLVLKKAQNLDETSSKLYKIDAYTISGGGNFTATAITGLPTIITSDGAVFSLDHIKLALTNSPNGTIQVIAPSITDLQPNVPTNLKQYKLDGVTEIPKGGTTTEEAIICEFKVSDPDNDHLIPYVWFDKQGGPTQYVTGETVTSPTISGVTVRIRVPASPGAFTANGTYEWEAVVFDPTGLSNGYDYAGDRFASGGTADFNVNMSLPDTTGPVATITAPTSGATVSGLVNINALIDDTATGNHNINAAEYFTSDTGPWTAGTGTPMTPVDGSFNSPSENVTAVWDSNTINNGTHVIRVRGRDSLGNWGALALVNVLVNNFNAPTVTSITPSIGQRGTTVNITDLHGTHFVSGMTVKLTRAGKPDISGESVSVVSTVKMTCVFNLPSTAEVGLWNVVVTNPSAQQGTLANGFSIVSDLATVPTVTNVYPRRAPSSESTAVKIIGTNFTGATGVDIQTIPSHSMTYAVDSPTMITATVPSGLTPGTWHITVANASGYSAQTTADTFEVMASKESPAVASMIKDFNASDGENGQSTLTWTNPTDNDMATVEVRRYNGAYPSAYNASSGTVVYKNIPAPGTAISTVDAGLTNGTTYYYVAFIGDTSGNWSTVDYTTPEINADTGTPSNIPPSGAIINLSITRDADAVGSSVTVKWQTSPTAHAAINIYTKTGSFDAVAADWTLVSSPAIIPSGDLDTYTDASQVGNGTAKYYKILPATATLQNSDLTQEVVGKFDLSVGPSDTEPDKFFISVPLIPTGSMTNSLVDVFGGQVLEGDGVLTFNMNKDVVTGSLYNSGAWGAFPGFPAIDSIILGRCYGFLTTSSRYISVVGKIFDGSPNSLALAGGWDTGNDRAAVAEWIATAYPMPVDLPVSGLTTATTQGTDPTNAGTVYQFNANADLMDNNGNPSDGNADGMAINTAGGWVDGTMTTPATLKLMPGRGYMLNEPVKTTFTWDQPKPY